MATSDRITISRSSRLAGGQRAAHSSSQLQPHAYAARVVSREKNALRSDGVSNSVSGRLPAADDAADEAEEDAADAAGLMLLPPAALFARGVAAAEADDRPAGE